MDRFGHFDDVWPNILAKHSVGPPLHMKDFRRPKGRLAHLSNRERQTLFEDVVHAINKHKIYSIAAVLTTDQYRKQFSSRFCKEGMGVYGACFILCCQMNHILAKQNNYSERIAFF